MNDKNKTVEGAETTSRRHFLKQSGGVVAASALAGTPSALPGEDGLYPCAIPGVTKVM